VSLFGSRYAGETARGSLLVDLRAALAGLGLGRQPGQSLPEDHLAAVFETMRLLIAGGPGISPRDIVTQRDFFRSFVASWIGRCCAAITENPVANLYRLVAECVSLFTAIEDENYAIA
jgi:TorA maturation chaperone TorD